MHRFPAKVVDPITNGRLYSSYGANVWIYKATTVTHNRPVADYWGTLSAPKRPNDVPLIIDSMWRGTGPMMPSENANHSEPPKTLGEWETTNQDMKHIALWRHKKGVNAVFFDGSARHIPAWKLWLQPWHRNYVPYDASNDGNLASETALKAWLNNKGGGWMLK
jgi:prepilin-type processing-associated H-X9-DG protein